jgi:hypothetical protein
LILSSAGSGSVIRRPVAASFLALFAAMSALYTIELAAGLTFAGNMAPRLFRSAMLAVGL